MSNVIDQSTEIDIEINSSEADVDIFAIEPEVKKKVVANPMLDEMEEEESDPIEVAKDLKQEEAEFYETLTDVEKEAWDQNWRKGKFFKGLNRDGSPRQEISAEEFLERSKKLAPIATERARKAAKEKAEAERENAELKKQIQQLIEYNKNKEDRDVAKSIQTLDKEEEQAILDGDLEAVRAIRKQKEELDKTKFKFEEPKVKEKTPPAEDQATFNDWLSVNNWYQSNSAIKGYADGLYNQIKSANPDMSLKEILEDIEADVKENFSEKLGLSQRKSISVNSGMRGAASGKVKTISYQDLPENARATCEKLIKLYKYTGKQADKMRADYVSEYK